MIMPLGDDNSDRTTFPLVTIALIAVNVLVFVVFQGMGANTKFTMAFSTVPLEITTGRDLVTEDEMVTIQTEEGPQEVLKPGLEPTPISVYLTILTSMFMHGGIAHLLGNMWFLWIFGDNIENDLGYWKYLAFYLLCGVLATMTHVLMSMSGLNSEIPSLGASGAISGVMGAYLVLHPQRRVTVLMVRFVTQIPGFAAVGLWFLFQIISSLGVLGGGGGGVAYGAHIGGFLAGALMALPLRSFVSRQTPRPQGWQESVARRLRQGG